MQKRISSWRRGEIFLEEIDWKKIATKKALDETKKAAINKEFQILSKLNDLWISFVPQVISSWDGFFSYEFIEGCHFKKFFESQYNYNNKKRLALLLLEKVYELDKTWVVHWELIRPYTNVLVSDKVKGERWKLKGESDKLDDFKISIIDFERWLVWDFSWKNMRSYMQWLRNNWFLSMEQTKIFGKITDSTLLYNSIKENIMLSIEIPTKNCKTTSRNCNKNFLTIYIWIFVLFLLDQISKYYFYNLWFFENHWIVTPILNKWISWGILLDFNLVYIISIFSLFIFIYCYNKKIISKYAFMLFIAWTVWNLVDRYSLWWVRDFIDLHFWPIFNLADVYLTFAVFSIIWREIVKK